MYMYISICIHYVCIFIELCRYVYIYIYEHTHTPFADSLDDAGTLNANRGAGLTKHSDQDACVIVSC